MYDPATEPDGAHRRWLREAPGHRCCLRGRVCCVRHGQPPTPPQQGARDDWRRTPARHDMHHAGKQTLFRGAERDEETMATITKMGGSMEETTRYRAGLIKLMYWQRCCSTSTPTASMYTLTLAASSTQTTCASRHMETTSTTSKRHSRLP